MHSVTATVLLAACAALVHAAPTPTKTQTKHVFKARAKGHKHRSPKDAMLQAYRKYGVQCSSDEPEQDPLAALESILSSPNNGGSESDYPWWLQPQASSSGIIVIIPSAAPSGSYGAAPIGSEVPISGYAAPSSAAQFSSGASFLPLSSGSPAVPSGASIVASASSQGWPAPSGGASGRPSSAAPTSSAPAPTGSSNSTGSGSDSGEVTASPEPNDAAYVSPVTIGGQQFNLDFDTGSADLWVFSTEMPASTIGQHAAFDPTKSSSFKNYQGGSWQIQYGDGSTASGTVGFDAVSIGGVVAPQQAVELAEQVSSSFLQYSNSDGLCGLAFSTINTVQPQQQKTFFENVMGSLDQPLFTADLEEDAAGTYEFGTVDSSKYTGDIHYTAVDNSNGFWAFQSTSYSIDGTQHARNSNTQTIADTGTSLVLLDDDVVKAYYAQVQGAQYDSQQMGYLYPCGANLPDFGIAVGDYTATLSGSQLTYANFGGGQCFGGVQPAGSAGVQILGDVFLKQYFAVFDGGNLQFGIAQKA